MTKQLLRFTLLCLICLSIPVVASAQIVFIPDLNLRAVIEEKLDKAPGATITVPDLQGLVALHAVSENITNLMGLEHATNLTELGLDDNSISDISPLAGLTDLEELNIAVNSISDISPLAGLTNLTVLRLDDNSISDISPLAGLTQLRELYLANNSISDLWPLVTNRGLSSGDKLNVKGNPLSDLSFDSYIALLRSRAVTVERDIPGLVEYIPNPNLRHAITKALRKARDDPLRLEDMPRLTELEVTRVAVNNVTGLELATNLTRLVIRKGAISDISPLAGLTQLRHLYLGTHIISDLSPLAGLTQLTQLYLEKNSFSDISPLAGLTNLTILELGHNKIRDISPLAGLTQLTQLYLEKNSFSDISPLARLTNLTILELGRNQIRDISPLARLINLKELDLRTNYISNILPLEGLTELTELYLQYNSISDLSPLVANTGLRSGDKLNVRGNPLNDYSFNTHITALQNRGVNVNSDHIAMSSETVNIPDRNLRRAIEQIHGKARGADITVTDMQTLAALYATSENIRNLTGLEAAINLTELRLVGNNITDISLLARLTKLRQLWLDDNSISDISPLAGLINLSELRLKNNAISDISPLVANTGLGTIDFVDITDNPLNSASINTHIPALQSRGVNISFSNLKPTASEYTLSIPAGISLIHVPLRVTEVDGVTQTIESISELYDVLGGAGTVPFLITYDSRAQEWRSYFGTSGKGSPADSGLSDDTGVIVGLRTPVSVHLRGTALGINGNSSINLGQGINVVGLPLNDSRINRVSDLFRLDGISGNVPAIIVADGDGFKAVRRPGDLGDIAITGGQALIMTAQRATTVTISGNAWANDSRAAATPPVTLKGIEVGDTTPVLGLRGAIVDEESGLKVEGFRVTVKNLSTARAVAASTSPDEVGYQSTVVDIETGRAAAVGDILEISAQSPSPFIGVKPLRYTVTTEDVKQSLIQLPELAAYEIPAETELLSNYPNPFNPETWIPYRLAKDAFVTLTIYDGAGQVVRTIDVGHQTAAAYESRSQAIYWDGKNQVGEQVASGVYFYHLSAGDYSATRKMLILK